MIPPSSLAARVSYHILGQVRQTARGGANVYLEDGPVSLIRSQNIYNEGFKVGGLTYIDEDAADKLKNVIVEVDDVLLNITGDSVARVCLAPDQYLPARVNQHVAIIRPDPKEFDSRFIRYYLITPAMQSYLLALAGSGATRNALTKGMIEGLEIPKPDIKIQREIADVLGALDKKIQLNRQTNQTLEQIAQAIFKSWFVDFEPVRAKVMVRKKGGSKQAQALAAQAIIAGTVTLEELKSMEAGYSGWEEMLHPLVVKNFEPLGLDLWEPEHLATTAALFPSALTDSPLGPIPEGWEVVELKNLSEKISKGTTPSKAHTASAEDQELVTFLKVRDISDYGEIKRDGLDKIPKSVHLNVLKRSVLQKNDLLFSIAGTIGRVAVIEEDLSNSNCNQAVAFIRLKDPAKHLELCRLNLVSNKVQDEVISKVVQGVQANFSLTGLGEIQVLEPTESFLNKFNEYVVPIVSKQRTLLAENRKLTELRDALLPKLLSGEISVGVVEKELEEAV